MRSLILGTLVGAGLLFLNSHALSLVADLADSLPVRLTRNRVAQIKGGMTLAEVMSVLGTRATINPDPAPFAYHGEEVLVIWRENKDKWVGVIFVQDAHRVLRVLGTGATNIGHGGL